MKKSNLIFRIVLSAGLLAYIISRLDLEAMKGVLDGFSPPVYAGAFAVLLLSQLAHAFLLSRLMGAYGSRPAASGAFKALAAGTFLGTFLPGSAGPDIMLGYTLSRDSDRKEKPLSAVVLARFLIVFSAILTALVFALYAGERFAGVRNIFTAAAGLMAGFAFITLNGRCSEFSGRIFSFLEKNRWTGLVYKTYMALSEFGRERRVFAAAVPLALATSALRVSVDYAVSRSLGLDIPPQYFFILVPLVSIAAVIPVSISGIGVREGVYVGLFSAAGVKAAEAFSISVLTFGAGIIFALIGAAVYITGGAGRADAP